MSNGLRLALNLIRKYLPEGAFSRIYLDEQPVDAGNYVAGALALESSDMNTAGFAMFKIKPKTNGVRMYWAQQAEKYKHPQFVQDKFQGFQLGTPNSLRWKNLQSEYNYS